jgi:hypothetical protein
MVDDAPNVLPQRVTGRRRPADDRVQVGDDTQRLKLRMRVGRKNGTA